MNKRNLFTAVGILLSFAIAIGGWLLTSRLIDMESNRLLSATTPVLADTPHMESIHLIDSSSHDSSAPTRLSEHEIASIVQQWDSGGLTWLHEPSAGQINMEQAIALGREGLDFLYDQNILPAEVLEFHDVRAYLSQVIPNSGQSNPLEHSHWNVRFMNEYVDIYMTINAVTGQVWRMNATVLQGDFGMSPIALHLSEDEIKAALSAFVSNLEIRPDGEIDLEIHVPADAIIMHPEEPGLTPINFGDTVVARQNFADGSATAMIAITGTLPVDGISHLISFHISLNSRMR